MGIDNNKKGLITKTWERCKSIGRARPTAERCKSIGPSSSVHGPPMASPHRRLPKKSKSWHGSPREEEDKGDAANQHHRRSCKDSGSKSRVAPEGCFSVYVGPQKQRFVVKTEHANHPLFRILLEQAEDEYGYNCAGPIELPCDVDVFFRVFDGDGRRRRFRHAKARLRLPQGRRRRVPPAQPIPDGDDKPVLAAQKCGV